MPIRNGNGSSPKVNPQDETPQFQFRGVWLPAHVINLLAQGQITSTDLLLLVMVESMVKYGGEGCWATNAYFAKALKVSEESGWVKKTIGKLKRMGLLIVYDAEHNGTTRRHLETSWSRQQGEGRCGAPGGGSPTTPRGGSPTTPISIPTEYNKGNAPPRSATPLDELSTSNQHNAHQAQADQLRKAVRNGGTSPTGGCRATWTEEFRKLANGEYTDVPQVLDWFCLNTSVKSRDEYGLPRITDAKQFRLRYDWIRRCYRNAKGINNSRKPVREGYHDDVI